MVIELRVKENGLPVFFEPNSLDSAALAINQLGRNLHEHAYICGKLLIWVKPQVGHGNFEQWVKENVWFSYRTARKFKAYSRECDSATTLLEYPLGRENGPNGHFDNLPLPIGLYDVIYADPPWQYDNAIQSWGPANLHYTTMSIEELCNLEIPSADNAVLFMWVTNPFLQDAFTVIEAWGFEYKTNIVWVKRNLQKPGSGFYVRGRHELLFICTKGSFVPDMSGKPPIGSVIEADVREHSRKPEIVYKIIEQIYPVSRYLELFARNTREDWTSWGDEIDG